MHFQISTAPVYQLRFYDTKIQTDLGRCWLVETQVDKTKNVSVYEQSHRPSKIWNYHKVPQILAEFGITGSEHLPMLQTVGKVNHSMETSGG